MLAQKNEAAQNESTYRETIPAHRAATVISRNFAFVQSGYIDPKIGRKVEPTVENLARLIDYATRFPVILPVVQWFVKNFQWYEPKELRQRGDYEDQFIDWLGAKPKHQRLEDEIERVRYGIRQLERAKEQLPQGRDTGSLPSAAGWSAGHLLERHFKFTPLPNSRLQKFWSGARTLGLIVDTSSGLCRVEKALHGICSSTSWERPEELMRTMRPLRTAMQMLELAYNKLPDRGAPVNGGHVIKTISNGHTPPVQRQKRADVADLSRRLAAATTPTEEQQILSQWQQHTNKGVR